MQYLDLELKGTKEAEWKNVRCEMPSTLTRRSRHLYRDSKIFTAPGHAYFPVTKTLRRSWSKNCQVLTPGTSIQPFCHELRPHDVRLAKVSDSTALPCLSLRHQYTFCCHTIPMGPWGSKRSVQYCGTCPSTLSYSSTVLHFLCNTVPMVYSGSGPVSCTMARVSKTPIMFHDTLPSRVSRYIYMCHCGATLFYISHAKP